MILNASCATVGINPNPPDSGVSEELRPDNIPNDALVEKQASQYFEYYSYNRSPGKYNPLVNYTSIAAKVSANPEAIKDKTFWKSLSAALGYLGYDEVNSLYIKANLSGDENPKILYASTNSGSKSDEKINSKSYIYGAKTYSGAEVLELSLSLEASTKAESSVVQNVISYIESAATIFAGAPVGLASESVKTLGVGVDKMWGSAASEVNSFSPSFSFTGNDLAQGPVRRFVIYDKPRNSSGKRTWLVDIEIAQEEIPTFFSLTGEGKFPAALKPYDIANAKISNTTLLTFIEKVKPGALGATDYETYRSVCENLDTLLAPLGFNGRDTYAAKWAILSLARGGLQFVPVKNVQCPDDTTIANIRGVGLSDKMSIEVALENEVSSKAKMNSAMNSLSTFIAGGEANLQAIAPGVITVFQSSPVFNEIDQGKTNYMDATRLGQLLQSKGAGVRLGDYRFSQKRPRSVQAALTLPDNTVYILLVSFGADGMIIRMDLQAEPFDATI